MKQNLTRGISLFIVSMSTPVFGQWVNFQNQTGSRVSAAPGVSTADPWEKDYAWGDLDKDGDIDLVVVRKWPTSCPGGKTKVLFMNENGVLTDRTSIFAQASDTAGDLGFNTETNDRDVAIVDIDNDTWLDVVTVNTIADGLPKSVGHPRVYRNRGEISGVWQGLRHEDFRIPQLLSKTGIAANPRFCELGVGDVTGDGYVDLYMADYDTGEVGPGENAANDMDNKLLINQGVSNPGVFVDQSTMRMGSTRNYIDGGSQNYLFSRFGAGAVLVDLNGDNLKDAVKCTTLTQGAADDHVAIMRNNPANPGFFDNYTVVDNFSPYHVQAADLNNDNKPDLIVSEDATDRYWLNTTATVGAVPTFSGFAFSGDATMGTEGNFSGGSRIADLDNDGWKDVIISDVDIDTDGCSNGRRSRVYHNLGNAPNVTLREVSPSVLPTSTLVGIYDTAIFDINGDGWNDIVVGKCINSIGNNCGGNPQGSMEVWINQPPVGVTFTLQGGPPPFLTPQTPTNLLIDIVPVGGSVQPGSAMIHTRINGGALVSTPMSPVSGNTYSGQLPAVSCLDQVTYYFSAIVSGTTFYEPSTAPGVPYSTLAASSVDVALESFEVSDNGWTVSNDVGLTGGAWVRVNPNSSSSGVNQAQPEDDFETNPNVMCWVTGQATTSGENAGLTDVDGGATRLMSPAIDLTGTNAMISYARWYFSSGAGDSFTVEVSNNGGANWATVLADTTSASAWETGSFYVGDYFPGQPLTANVHVRFSVADTGTATTVDGALDAFQVSKVVCVTVPQCACRADMNEDEIPDGLDIQKFVNCYLGIEANCVCAEFDQVPGLSDDDMAAFVNEISLGAPCP